MEPQATPDDVGRSRAPWGLIGLAVLVTAVEGFVWRHAAEFTDPVALSWRIGGESARGPRERADVICLGDSQVKLGVQPRILEARLGVRVHNLAVLAGQAPSSYFLLRRALRSGARPRAVVVDFHPGLLRVGPQASRSRWADLVDLGDGLDLLGNSSERRFFAEVAARWLLPSNRDRLGVREGLLSALRGDPGPSVEKRLALRRNWSVNGGAHVAAVGPPVEDGATTSPDDPRDPGWSASPTNVAYMGRLFDLSAARGILVFWVIPPSAPAWQARRERGGWEDAYDRFVRSMLRRHPDVLVVDARHAGYVQTAFADATHLNRIGAAELSAALGEVMAGRMGAARPGPRWVALPRYRGRVEGVPLEDVEQSRLAVAAAGAARR